ncbi:hypothetical protein HMPREF1548_06462 [Clostridium sp. KLE 1755]|nr:hypothetical protein HMPREF1548_06462 [Clostridium sp. KLE 1755]
MGINIRISRRTKNAVDRNQRGFELCPILWILTKDCTAFIAAMYKECYNRIRS